MVPAFFAQPFAPLPLSAAPGVFTAVAAHGDSSVDIVTRVWVDTGDYWGVHFDAMKNVKEAFDKNDISIPYPHRVNIAKKA